MFAVCGFQVIRILMDSQTGDAGYSVANTVEKGPTRQASFHRQRKQIEAR